MWDRSWGPPKRSAFAIEFGASYLQIDRFEATSELTIDEPRREFSFSREIFRPTTSVPLLFDALSRVDFLKAKFFYSVAM